MCVRRRGECEKGVCGRRDVCKEEWECARRGVCGKREVYKEEPLPCETTSRWSQYKVTLHVRLQTQSKCSLPETLSHKAVGASE